MILYYFNSSYPDNTGFAIRVKRELDLLKSQDKITVVCRQPKKNVLVDDSDISYIFLPSVSEADRYDFFTTLRRSFNLFFGFFYHLAMVTLSSRENIQLYSVVSPMTVSAVGLCFALLPHVRLRAIEFHDLEPEMAQHIKGVSASSFLYKLELLLEKVLCRAYQKVVVTNLTQAERITNRTGITKDKVLVFENVVEHQSLPKKTKIGRQLVVGYASTLTYSYATDGLFEILADMAQAKEIDYTLVVVGDGEKLESLKSEVQRLGLSNQVQLLGNISNYQQVIQSFDLGIIPWRRNPMSETILPTKLFEYMSRKLPIIAPRFGEFSRLLTDRETALLFDDVRDIRKLVTKLNQDYHLTERIANNAYQLFLKKYQPSVTNKKYLQFFGDA